ncbi:MAG: HD-GYP domain-containing protein [Candidatus Nanopelagicales bacterium]
MEQTPLAARRWVQITVGLAAFVLVLSLATGVDWSVVLPLAAMVALVDRVFRVPGDRPVAFLVTSPLVIGSFALGGPASAALVAAATLAAPGSSQWIKRLFNAGQYVVAAYVGGWVYLLLGGDVPISASSFPWVVLQFLAAALAFEVVNALFVIVVVSLAERMSPARVYRGMVRENVLPVLMYSLFGLLLAVVWAAGVGWVASLLVLLPLAVARWVFAQFEAQREAYESTIRSLIQAVETKDAYTRGHSERVARASLMIGRRIRMRDDRLESLRYAGTLHDVGKLGVPTRVLQKAGRLSDDEFAAIQLHPVRGREITRELDFLGEAVMGIYHHHERIDGRGYPLGLTGEQIPEFARIIAVADAFDSMTTTRSYRGARSVGEAVAELIACKGTQFDPGMVDALVDAIDQDGWVTITDALPPLVDVPDAADRMEPSFGVDDDDPTAADALAAHRPAAAEPRPGATRDAADCSRGEGRGPSR